MTGRTPQARSPGTSTLLSPTLLVLLFMVALAGRHALPGAADPDGVFHTRTLGAAILVVLVLLWRSAAVGADFRHRWPLAARLAVAFFGYQAASALWSPPGARTGKVLTDLLVLGVLVAVTVSVTAPDPDRAAHILLVLLFAAALPYAVAGLHTVLVHDTHRVSAFGGGPNVYVRVVCLGALAAAALAVRHRNPLWLLPLPAEAAAALLSGSRGGVTAAVVTALAVLVRYGTRLRLRTLLGLAGSVGVTGFLCWRLLATQLAEVVQRRFIDLTLHQRYLSERPRLLEAAWETFREHPVLGAGLDGFYVDFGFESSIPYPHNYLAAVAAEGGIVGIALLAATLYATVRAATPLRRLPVERLACLVGAFYVSAAALFSGDYYDSRFAWILAFAAVTAPGVTREPEAAPGPVRSGV